ncbi:MAG TPA: carboxypeptidase-like regulatory domain-containing protein [Candidatus Acidoferrales bacterium]
MIARQKTWGAGKVAICCALLCLGQFIATPRSGAQSSTDANPGTASVSGTITGTVLDATGSVVSGASVSLTRGDQSPASETRTNNNGQFSFNEVPPGAFQVTISLAGFATQTTTGTLRSADTFIVPTITLPLATVTTSINVVPQEEVAEREIKQEEKQRVLGVVPNFYVTYLPDAVPLTTKQKFELAWKSTVDPVSFAITGAVAGIQQANNSFSGYGQGAAGYGKRYGAAYADLASGTFIGSAILPSLFKQDPRYFYKGTGTVRFRLLYALANAVICKGDNRRWQPNYSNILGNIAAGGISNIYYPAQNRNGAALTFESALIGIGATAAANVIEEFVIRKITPNVPSENAESSPRKSGTVRLAFNSAGD